MGIVFLDQPSGVPLVAVPLVTNIPGATPFATVNVLAFTAVIL